MSPVTLMLLTLAAVLWLSVPPAYLFFKALPSRSDVSGPFQGLEIKLGGAFAGYFVLVWLVLSHLSTIKEAVKAPPQQSATDQVWWVKGQVVDEHGQPIEPLGAADIQLAPRSLDVEPNGYFKAKITTSLLPAGNGVEFPRLNITHDGYTTRTILLDPPTGSVKGDETSRDEAHHVINLQAAQLAKLPQYSTTGSPPEQVANPQYPASGRPSTATTTGGPP